MAANNGFFAGRRSDPVISKVKPSLLFDPEDVTTIRVNAAGTHAALWTQIEGQADSLAATPTSSTVDATNTLSARDLLVICFTAVADPDATRAAHITKALAWLDGVAGWARWGGDTGTGEEEWADGLHTMIGYFAISMDMMWNEGTLTQRNTWASALQTHVTDGHTGITTAWTADHLNFYPGSFVQNHHHTALYNLTIGILGLEAYTSQATLDNWMKDATNLIERSISILSTDGAWAEGLALQQHLAYKAIIQYNFILRRKKGIDNLQSNWLKRFADFMVHNFVFIKPELLGRFSRIGDMMAPVGASNGMAPWWNMLFYIADRFDLPVVQWVANEMASNRGRPQDSFHAYQAVFEWFMWNPSQSSLHPASSSQKTYKHFSDIGFGVTRSGWASSDKIFSMTSMVTGGQHAFNKFTQTLYPYPPPSPLLGAFNQGHRHSDRGQIYIRDGKEEVYGEHSETDRTHLAHSVVRVTDPTAGTEYDQFQTPSDDAQINQLVGFQPTFEYFHTSKNYCVMFTDLTPCYRKPAPGMESLLTKYYRMFFISHRTNMASLVDSIVKPSAGDFKIRLFGQVSAVLPDVNDWVILGAPASTFCGVNILTGQPGFTFAAGTKAGTVANINYVDYQKINASSVEMWQFLYPADSVEILSPPTLTSKQIDSNTANVQAVHSGDEEWFLHNFGRVSGKVSMGDGTSLDGFAGSFTQKTSDSKLQILALLDAKALWWKDGPGTLIVQSAVAVTMEIEYFADHIKILTAEVDLDRKLRGLQCFLDGMTVDLSKITINGLPVANLGLSTSVSGNYIVFA